MTSSEICVENMPALRATTMLNKVPAVTLVFWIIKIMSTTVGETGADYLAVHVGLGAARTGAIMGALLIAALILQLRTRRYVAWIYWLTVVLVSIVGTQITDALTDGLEISLHTSTISFATALAATFCIWYVVTRGSAQRYGSSQPKGVTTPETAKKIVIPKEALSPSSNPRRMLMLMQDNMQKSNNARDMVLSKVPEVTLVFWIVKIAATTLGETGGDTVTMTLNWGYLVGTAIFFSLLVILVIWQILADKFHPILYWATIVASTTAGTTMADFADRSLGIGYAGGSSLLFACLMLVLALWYWSERSISVDTVNTPKVEAFYWAAITFSQTLGTALGDWMADNTGLGYRGGALVFGAGLAALAIAYYRTNISRVLLFWAAFILTRPLGATVGDFLDKPISDGGLALSRPIASAVIAVFMVGCILLLPQRPDMHPGRSEAI
jgi:uncharacterized membrane-anchored protein